MRQYKVLQPMINAPVGTIISDDMSSYMLKTSSGETCLYGGDIEDAIAQKFIEPYTTEPKHWRANKYTTYYYVCTMLDTIEARADQQLEFDNNKHNSGNYFKSQATAEIVAKAQKLFFEWLHSPGAYSTMEDGFSQLTFNLSTAMDEAKKAVLEDDSNE